MSQTQTAGELHQPMRRHNRHNDTDTDIGGPLRNFPETNRSAVAAVRSDEPQVRRRAFDVILHSYWKPVYKYVRIKWDANNEDAKDLTQGFFANAFEKNHLADYDAARASFQTFLRTCIDGYVANQRKAERRLKRGGGLDHVSLDFNGAENELALHPPASDVSPEEYFQREWVRNLFLMSIQALRNSYDESGNEIRFHLFERYDLEDSPGTTVSYASLASEFGLTTTTVNNHLAAARRDFRKILLEKLRQTTATDEEFRNQARELLGIEVK